MPTLIAQYGVLIVALIIFAGEIGIPTLVPGEIAILIAGSQVVHSVPELIGLVLLFGAVDIAACSTIHAASRTGGNRLLVRLLRKLQPHHDRHEEVVEGWRRRLGGHDPLVVFVTRLIPIFRLYASITTGLIRVRLRDFVTGAAPAALLWAATPLTLGFVLRSKIGGLEGQYPQMLHIVITFSVVSTVAAGVVWWVRRAGSRAAALRRIRVVFGLAAVGGALTRLVLVALYGDRQLSYPFLPPLSALSVWVMVFSLVALGLLWIAALDLRVIRRYQHHTAHRLELLSVTAWGSLMAAFCALNTLAGVQHAVLLG
jgi:membrane protein DedA with SNARE-associated domain